MRVYLSGPMTGYPDHNFPAFNDAAGRLRAAGYEVVNPADGGADPTRTWADYLRADLYDVLSADTVAVLPDWHASRGAALEVHVAHALGTPVVPVDVLLAAQATDSRWPLCGNCGLRFPPQDLIAHALTHLGDEKAEVAS